MQPSPSMQCLQLSIEVAFAKYGRNLLYSCVTNSTREPCLLVSPGRLEPEHTEDGAGPALSTGSRRGFPPLGERRR